MITLWRIKCHDILDRCSTRLVLCWFILFCDGDRHCKHKCHSPYQPLCEPHLLQALHNVYSKCLSASLFSDGNENRICCSVFVKSQRYVSYYRIHSYYWQLNI